MEQKAGLHKTTGYSNSIKNIRIRISFFISLLDEFLSDFYTMLQNSGLKLHTSKTEFSYPVASYLD